MVLSSKPILKLAALTLVLCLVSEHISFANPELKVEGGRSKVEGKETALPLGVRLPESIATIEETYLVSREAYLARRNKEGASRFTNDASRVLVYLLQDAHTNPSGQL
ncbi:MAG: hypothetical protein HY593_04865, partial [Candidatus Omnitrophica bacterium]|nr:hypothetical protein [Candidatus Omnitrophota bacterium]